MYLDACAELGNCICETKERKKQCHPVSWHHAKCRGAQSYKRDPAGHLQNV